MKHILLFLLLTPYALIAQQNFYGNYETRKDLPNYRFERGANFRLGKGLLRIDPDSSYIFNRYMWGTNVGKVSIKGNKMTMTNFKGKDTRFFIHKDDLYEDRISMWMHCPYFIKEKNENKDTKKK